jgi:serine protease Do
MTPDEIKKTGYEGVIITNVKSGSAAENAGLKEGDIIREVNRKMIKSTDDFDNIISKVDKGDTIALLVARGEFTFYVAIQL